MIQAEAVAQQRHRSLGQAGPVAIRAGDLDPDTATGACLQQLAETRIIDAELWVGLAEMVSDDRHAALEQKGQQLRPAASFSLDLDLPAEIGQALQKHRPRPGVELRVLCADQVEADAYYAVRSKLAQSVGRYVGL